MDGGAWWAAIHGVAKSRTRLSDFTFTFHFHALEKEMATHCSVLAGRIPGMGEPDGLPSMGSHRVGHDWSDLAAVQLSLVAQQPPVLQRARPPCPSPTPRIYSNSHPLSRWYHPNFLSSVIPFSPCPQSFPASGSFQMSQLFATGGQNIGVSALASVLPVNTQDWSPLGGTGWISLQSKGLPRVFNTTVQKHQLFSAQLSL